MHLASIRDPSLRMIAKISRPMRDFVHEIAADIREAASKDLKLQNEDVGDSMCILGKSPLKSMWIDCPDMAQVVAVEGEKRLSITTINSKGVMYGSIICSTVIDFPFERDKPNTFMGKECVAQVAQGYAHAAAVTVGGDLFLNFEKSQLLTKSFVVQVACGISFTAAVTAHGELFTWGCGTFGQLGHGSTDDQTSPTLVEFFADHWITHVATGAKHTAAVTAHGELFTWGHGKHGQLGHGLTSDRKATDEHLPKQVEQLRGVHVVQVQAPVDGHFTAVVTQHGDLYTFGSNECANLGLPYASLNDIEHDELNVRENGVVDIEYDECPNEYYRGMSIPKRVSLSFVKQVACGKYHMAIVTKSATRVHGKLYTCGGFQHPSFEEKNVFDMLGLGEVTESVPEPQLVRSLLKHDIVQVSASKFHTVVLVERNLEPM